MPAAELDPIVLEEIERINSEGQLETPIDIPAVAESLSLLDGETAFEVLHGLLEEDLGVENPNVWICEAAAALSEQNCNSTVQNSRPGVAPQCPGLGDVTSSGRPAKVRRIQWDRPHEYVPRQTTTYPVFTSSRMRPGGKNFLSGSASLGYVRPRFNPGAPPPTKSLKSQMCRRFSEGLCRMEAAACRFAHSEEEREAELGDQLERLNRKLANFKTRLCQSFADGRCMKGDSCTFAHGRAELLDHNGEPLQIIPDKITKPTRNKAIDPPSKVMAPHTPPMSGSAAPETPPGEFAPQTPPGDSAPQTPPM